MKKRLKEMVIILIQLFIFYIFPLFAGPTDAIGMVFFILIATFLLAATFGYISNHKLKLIYPIFVSILFIPSVFLYYNESALVHALWYLVTSYIGLFLGYIINFVIGKKDNKFDFHMHTTCSDGSDTPIEILKKANALNLEVISITDHNSCNAYEEFRNVDIKKIYKGKIISGCEFTTSFDNRLIEVLGYGLDVRKINEFLKKYYTKEKNSIRINTLYDKLLEKANALGLTYSLDVISKSQLANISYNRIFFNELSKYPENREIVKEHIWDSNNSFFRKGLCNPESLLFINPASYYPSIEEIVNVIHDSGGKAFLAHPYIYAFDDLDIYLDILYDNVLLDGIETFYLTFNNNQVKSLIDFAKKRNLLMSCGSDYHGKNRPENRLGLETKAFIVPKNLLDNWDINFFDTKADL